MTLRTPLFALLILAGCFVVSGCLEMDVVTEIISEKHSPDDLWTAAVFTSDAGATTSTATIVNIRPKRLRFAKREDTGDVFVVTHTKLVEVEWISKDELLIKVQGSPRVFRQLVKSGDVSIRYDGINLEQTEAPPTQLAADEQLKLVQPGPAAGRAELISPLVLIPDPARYSGRRIILSGIWITGFELSTLDLENKAQDFRIWVEADWVKIDEPIGDLSRRKEEDAKPSPDGHEAHRIVAEGTFYYRKVDLKSGVPGFGHMGVSEGYFLIDRLFQFDPFDLNETNKGPKAAAQ